MVMADFLQKFPVVDVASEKMPIERVLNTLMVSPELMPAHKKNENTTFSI